MRSQRLSDKAVSLEMTLLPGVANPSGRKTKLSPAESPAFLPTRKANANRHSQTRYDRESTVETVRGFSSGKAPILRMACQDEYAPRKWGVVHLLLRRLARR